MEASHEGRRKKGNHTATDGQLFLLLSSATETSEHSLLLVLLDLRSANSHRLLGSGSCSTTHLFEHAAIARNIHPLRTSFSSARIHCNTVSSSKLITRRCARLRGGGDVGNLQICNLTQNSLLQGGGGGAGYCCHGGGGIMHDMMIC